MPLQEWLKSLRFAYTLSWEQKEGKVIHICEALVSSYALIRVEIRTESRNCFLVDFRHINFVIHGCSYRENSRISLYKAEIETCTSVSLYIFRERSGAL